MPKSLDERLDVAIASRFTTSLMSNAKWRKAFRILSAPTLGLSMFTFKQVELADDVDADLRRNARPPRDAVEAFMWLDKMPKPDMISEFGIGDCLVGGPLYYRAIEWIEIPAQYVVLSPERPVVQQDIVAAAHALSMAGHFPMELTDARLRLYGYH